MRTAQYLSRRRLFHAARGKLFCVDERAGVIALDEQQHFPEEHVRHGGFEIALRIHLAKGHIALDERLHRGRVVHRFERQPEAQHPLDDRIVTVAVHDPQPRAFSADAQIARDHIKAAPHAEKLVQRAHIFLMVFR